MVLWLYPFAIKMSGVLNLVNNWKLKLEAPVKSNGRENERSVVLHFTAESNFANDGSEKSYELLKILRSLLAESKDGSGRINVTFVQLKDEFAQSNSNNGGELRIHGPLLDEICKTPYYENIVMKVAMKNIAYFNNWHWQHVNGTVTTKDMIPKKICDQDSVVFEDTPAEEFENLVSVICDGANIKIHLTLSLDISVKFKVTANTDQLVSCKSKIYNPPPQELVSFMQNILQNKFETDTVIIDTDGTDHPCHKIILTGSSPVLQTMFGNKDDVEAKTHSITLSNMTGKGVEALLGYLYYLDVTAATDDFEIAMELLDASQKLDIDRLTMSIKNILLLNLDAWKEPERALRVFCFAISVQNWDELKAEAVKAMKLLYKELIILPCYEELFKNNQSAAKELCTALFVAGENTAN